MNPCCFRWSGVELGLRGRRLGLGVYVGTWCSRTPPLRSCGRGLLGSLSWVKASRVLVLDVSWASMVKTLMMIRLDFGVVRLP
ncbi:hypothetical protein L596_000611 [Steinernema carpocapsae]|uniref:Uncharacterized protein n=1 Tax=Steinernema carpocapsae TaxID=34508 RepID=A0A4U8UIL1_STECR|nr:hypothetical protein L596_000611 [Steinernema carpocapsae]